MYKHILLCLITRILLKIPLRQNYENSLLETNVTCEKRQQEKESISFLISINDLYKTKCVHRSNALQLCDEHHSVIRYMMMPLLLFDNIYWEEMKNL